MDEPKPVNCGCGGEARIMQPSYTHCRVVMCPNCGIKTAYMNSEAEAVTAWNRAMGKDKVSELMEHIWRDKLDTREKIAELVERMLR